MLSPSHRSPHNEENRDINGGLRISSLALASKGNKQRFNTSEFGLLANS
jgi:hypothetical protein